MSDHVRHERTGKSSTQPETWQPDGAKQTYRVSGYYLGPE